MDLGTVNVLPPHVEELPVRQDPRSVFLLRIGGDRTHIFAVGTASVKIRHAGQPALDPPFRAARGKNDVTVGKVRRFNVVPIPVGQLTQTRTVQVDLVEMVVPSAGFQVGENALSGVVVDLRIANVALRVLKKSPDFSGFQIQDPKRPASSERKGKRIRIARIVPEIGVPVSVKARLTHREKELLYVFHGTAGRSCFRQHF